VLHTSGLLQALTRRRVPGRGSLPPGGGVPLRFNFA